MKISEMVNYLTDILVKQGDLELYQASDDEGNNYFKVIQKPEVRFILTEGLNERGAEYLYDDLNELYGDLGEESETEKVLLI